MDGQTDTASIALIDFAHFEARSSPEGRLLQYARARIRAFWVRQTLTAFGSLTILALASVPLGVLLAGIALLGEAVDIVTLRWVIRRLEAGQTGPVPRVLAIASGGAQGLTIAACVVLSWQSVPLNEARFFAAAFLIGACINAGLARPFFRPAADIRLGIFMLTAFAMLALDLSQTSYAMSRAYGFFAAGFGLLIYISLLFIRLLERNHSHRQRQEYALLKHQQDQELAQDLLAHGTRHSQRLALVAKYANDSIIICEPSGRIEWVNDSFTRITGYEFDEVIGRFPGDVLNAPDTDAATLDKIRHAVDTHTPLRVEILNKAKSGRLLWIETSMIPIFEKGVIKLWIAVERDVTEAKEREAELARARLAAEEAGQSKSRFLANMSHEIRTPMNGVIGVADLLSETSLSKIQATYVDTILESGKALLGVINDILDLAKLQSGKATLEALPFSPRLCIEGALRILGTAAGNKGLELKLAAPLPDGLPDGLPDRLVLGDEGKLRQIVLNLVGNAVKFTDQGAVTVALRLPSAATDFMEIEVADSGIGIAHDRIAAIFDSFSQADNGISRQFGGTGLGLTICSMLAQQMGGGIVVRSEIGHGSVFTLRVRLPLAQASAMQAPPQERRAVARLRPGLRVMVAEDNRTNMMIVRMMLQGSVHTLTEVTDGAQAVTLYQSRPPDLVLMDVSMPVKDGLQATRDIRLYERTAGLPHCPVVALTANAFGEDREACRLAGFDGFLVKPLSRADLLTAINAFCPERPKRPRTIGL